MMIIDHAAAGALLPQTIKGFQNSTALGVSLIASLLPDLPVMISGWQGSIGYLSHRAATHSLVLAPLLSIVPVLLIYFPFRSYIKNTFFELYLLSFLSFCIHILFDLITPFGTQVFFPFSRKQYSLDLLHSFDPIFMVMSGIVILVSILHWKNNKFLTATSIIVLLSVYLVYCAVNCIRKYSDSMAFKSHIAASYEDAVYRVTVPKTYWRWKGIAQTENAYIVASRIDGTLSLKVYPRIVEVPEFIRQDDYYIKFLKYARYPVIEMKKHTIEVHNLIYAPDSYRLILFLDETGNGVEKRDLTGFNLVDKSN